MLMTHEPVDGLNLRKFMVTSPLGRQTLLFGFVISDTRSFASRQTPIP